MAISNDSQASFAPPEHQPPFPLPSEYLFDPDFKGLGIHGDRHNTTLDLADRKRTMEAGISSIVATFMVFASGYLVIVLSQKLPVVVDLLSLSHRERPSICEFTAQDLDDSYGSDYILGMFDACIFGVQSQDDRWILNNFIILMAPPIAISLFYFYLLYRKKGYLQNRYAQTIFCLREFRSLLRCLIAPDKFTIANVRASLLYRLREEINNPDIHLKTTDRSMDTSDMVYDLYIAEVQVRRTYDDDRQLHNERRRMLIEVERNDLMLASLLEAEATRYVREAEQARFDRDQDRWKRTMKSVDELRNTLIQTTEALRNHPSLAHLLTSFEDMYEELNRHHPDATRDAERMAGMGERVAQQHFRDTYGVNPNR